MNKQDHQSYDKVTALYKQVYVFIKAWKKIPKDNFHFEWFKDYPKDCCEFCSYLLGKYLHEEYSYYPLFLLQGKNRFTNIDNDMLG